MSKRTSKTEYNEYMNAYMKERWRKRRLAAIEYLGGKCVTCGNEDGLEFDHADATDKSFPISQAVSYSEARFWPEVEKCQLLCTPCHLVKSRQAGDFLRYRSSKPIQHGHSSGYNRAKCRCEECKEWKRESRKKYTGVCPNG